jgi:hypothetical protein
MKLSDAFIHSVDDIIENCSSIYDLIVVFERFKIYIKNKYIFNSFMNKLDLFKDRSVDDTIDTLCKNLENQINTEYAISSDNNYLDINILVNTSYGNVFNDLVKECLRHALVMAGSKKLACQLLGITEKDYERLEKTDNLFEN